MVHRVLSIDVCVVRDLYVKYTFLPNKIVYCLQAIIFYPSRTVRLTSIVYPQIEGKFAATTGGLTNLFYGCKD